MLSSPSAAPVAETLEDTQVAETPEQKPVASPFEVDGARANDEAEDDGDDDGELFEAFNGDIVGSMHPPEKVSEKALKKRLYRIMKPRADGSFKVPKGLLEEYHDDVQKWKVFRLFEKCGYNPDHGMKNMMEGCTLISCVVHQLSRKPWSKG